jgi:uroporphyrinogen-III synthase
MRIIVTRPEEDAGPLAEKLKILGHAVINLPLIQIVPRPSVVIPHGSYQLICLTSANGVRHLQAISGHENTPLVAIGAQSLVAAKNSGFKNASAHGGDVDGLAAYVKGNYKPKDGTILYLSGSTISGDLEGQLKSVGFTVDRIITYDATSIKLNDSVDAILSADAVMLYSPRIAKIWSSEIIALELNEAVAVQKHFCLSTNVAAALPQSWEKRIAREPTESAMLDLLD